MSQVMILLPSLMTMKNMSDEIQLCLTVNNPHSFKFKQTFELIFNMELRQLPYLISFPQNTIIYSGEERWQFLLCHNTF
jgi:hypothetical protein